jgi:hypothetical protein
MFKDFSTSYFVLSTSYFQLLPTADCPLPTLPMAGTQINLHHKPIYYISVGYFFSYRNKVTFAASKNEFQLDSILPSQACGYSALKK